MSTTMNSYRSSFPDWNRLTAGTSHLGNNFSSTWDDVRLIRTAMDLDLPLHTSRCYNDGQALNILKLAFRERPNRIPPVMAKIYCYNATQIRLDVEEILERLKLDRLPVGQLAKNDHRQREIVDDILEEGPMFETLCELRQKDLVGHWTFEVFQKYTPDVVKALKNDLFDSIGLYFSSIEREADEATWNLINERGKAVVAIRGLAGGLAVPGQDNRAGKPGKPERWVKQRRELESIYKESGCSSWPEFTVRFLFSLPMVRTTIIGTNNPERLALNQELCQSARPLPATLVEQILAHQHRWTANRVFDPNSPYV